MSTVAFSGLSSGIDTASLIDKLVAVEQSSANTLTSRQSDLNTQKSIVNSLSSVLSSLGSLARSMKTASTLMPRLATSSDSHISVAASANADVTTHTVTVTSLAHAQVTASSTFASNTAGIAGTGSLDITVAGTKKTVSWAASDTLSTIASKINDANAGASASVLYDGSTYRLIVTASKTGTADAPTFAETGSALGLTNPANIKVPASNAVLNVDGVDITRSTNVVDDAIPGLTLTLLKEHATDDPPTGIGVTLDRDGLKKKLGDLVTAYNAVNSALHIQLDYNGTKKGSNTLFGDSTLRQLQSSLQGVLGKAYGGMSLAGIGLARDKSGNMTLDTATLDKALAADSHSVDKLMSSGGLASAIQSLADTYTRANDGALAAKSKTIENRYKSLQTQIDHINSRADSLRKQLETQFTAMEQAMSQLQSQSSYLSKIL